VKNLVVLGMQWGDEGKGKIVDLLIPDYDINVRFQGGNNAGHTVKFGTQHFALHLIPSGILHEGKICVLGNGMVIDPEALTSEMEHLRSRGIRMDGNLFISDRAQLILPHHKLLDKAREDSLKERSIGTTGRGIGPSYESKIFRYGLRTGDLQDRDVMKMKLDKLIPALSGLLEKVYGVTSPGVEETIQFLDTYMESILPHLADTAVLINSMGQIGRSILFEGAQGTMLDVDHGTYPFVTSSNCTVGGVLTGSGASPHLLGSIMGVLKAYTTRVGGGPFPTELKDKFGDKLRSRGNEFGTTTGRPRRTGWLDLVAARYAVMLNGINQIALTKLDVLDDFEEIPICTKYRLKGTVVESPPAADKAMAKVSPDFDHLPGWAEQTTSVTRYEDLPANARHYVEYIEDFLKVKATIISTGPRREETIVRN